MSLIEPNCMNASIAYFAKDCVIYTEAIKCTGIHFYIVFLL